MDDVLAKEWLRQLDLTPYAGRWVAIVRGGVTGVGMTEHAARLAAKYQRSKEEPVVIFVSETLTKDEGLLHATGE